MSLAELAQRFLVDVTCLGGSLDISLQHRLCPDLQLRVSALAVEYIRLGFDHRTAFSEAVCCYGLAQRKSPDP